MLLIFPTILFLHFLQNNLMLQIIAKELNLDELMGYDRDRLLRKLLRNSKSESAHWPLQAGYSDLAIKNLNEYISLFSHCLVNIQNYQGIEIIGIQSPVYITRFDVALVEVCDDYSDSLGSYRTRRFFFGRFPPKSERNCATDYSQAINYTDKSTNSRWYCRAQFDLLFPEPKDAPHIVHHSQISGINNLYNPVDRNLFDVSLEYITSTSDVREEWSKILNFKLI